MNKKEIIEGIIKKIEVTEKFKYLSEYKHYGLLEECIEKIRHIISENIEEIKQWIIDHDVAFISASRKAISHLPEKMSDDPQNVTNPEDVKLFDRYGQILKDDEGNEYKAYPLSDADNIKRDKDLGAILKSYGFETKNAKGWFPEGGTPHMDYTYFVYNKYDKPDFYSTLFYLSAWYNQDSFIYKAKHNDIFKFVGTNDYWPGWKKVALVGTDIAWNVINKFMTEFYDNETDRETMVIHKRPIKINQNLEGLSDGQIQNILTQEVLRNGKELRDNTTIYNDGSNIGDGYIYQYNTQNNKWRFLKRYNPSTFNKDIQAIMKESKMLFVEDVIKFGSISSYHGNAQQIVGNIGSGIMSKICAHQKKNGLEPPKIT
jgi:hypothetical protein